jgi:hypothetical protein
VNPVSDPLNSLSVADGESPLHIRLGFLSSPFFGSLAAAGWLRQRALRLALGGAVGCLAVERGLWRWLRAEATIDPLVDAALEMMSVLVFEAMR